MNLYADYMLNYGFSGDSGLFTIYEGKEVVFETDSWHEFAHKLLVDYEVIL